MKCLILEFPCLGGHVGDGKESGVCVVDSSEKDWRLFIKSLPSAGLAFIPKTPKSLLLTGQLQESTRPAGKPAKCKAIPPGLPPPALLLGPCGCVPHPPTPRRGSVHLSLRWSRKESHRRSPHFLLHKAIFKPLWCFHAAGAVL